MLEETILAFVFFLLLIFNVLIPFKNYTTEQYFLKFPCKNAQNVNFVEKGNCPSALDAKANKELFHVAFKSAVLCLKCFPFFLPDSQIKVLLLRNQQKLTVLHKLQFFFFFLNFKALAYAGHMAEDGTQRSCVSRVLLFNDTVREAQNDSMARQNRICLLHTRVKPIYFIKRRMMYSLRQNDGEIETTTSKQQTKIGCLECSIDATSMIIVW